MSIRRRFTPAISEEPTTDRISALESEIRSLRPSRLASHPPVPMPIEDSRRALFLLAEMTHQQIAAGLLADARRSIADAVLLLDEQTDEATIARACVMLGECLLALDAAQHAKPLFGRAVAILDRLGGTGRWDIRARLGLGRALVALDDMLGLEVLKEVRRACAATGEESFVAEIDLEVERAQRYFDTPRHVRTGYGRMISVMPPKRDEPL